MNKNKNIIISIGMLSMALSILLARFGPDYRLVDFFEGLLIGISIPVNLIGIYLFVREKKQKMAGEV